MQNGRHPFDLDDISWKRNLTLTLAWAVIGAAMLALAHRDTGSDAVPGDKLPVQEKPAASNEGVAGRLSAVTTAQNERIHAGRGTVPNLDTAVSLQARLHASR